MQNNFSVQDEHTRQEYTTACMPAPNEAKPKLPNSADLKFSTTTTQPSFDNKFCNISKSPIEKFSNHLSFIHLLQQRIVFTFNRIQHLSSTYLRHSTQEVEEQETQTD